MFNAALPKSPSTSPGASISLQQGGDRGSSAMQSRDSVCPQSSDKEDCRSSAADGSVRRPVGIKLMWKEQGHEKYHKKPCKAATFFIVSVPCLVIEMRFFF